MCICSRRIQVFESKKNVCGGRGQALVEVPSSDVDRVARLDERGFKSRGGRGWAMGMLRGVIGGLMQGKTEGVNF